MGDVEYQPISANKTKPSWCKELCPTADDIVLNLVIHKGSNAHLEQVKEPRGLGLGGLVIDHPSQTLHPNTNVYCDRFFTFIQGVERTVEKEMYVTGTVLKILVAAAVQEATNWQTMKKDRRARLLKLFFDCSYFIFGLGKNAAVFWPQIKTFARQYTNVTLLCIIEI